MQRQPGEFRQTQVWIGGHRPDHAVFVPPPAHEVPDCIASLERFLNDVDGPTAPLLKAALAHVQFETIHPFLDGNGRMGRLLIALILAEAGVLREPLLYLSVFFKRHRQAYYQLLQDLRARALVAWANFFAEPWPTPPESAPTGAKSALVLAPDAIANAPRSWDAWRDRPPASSMRSPPVLSHPSPRSRRPPTSRPPPQARCWTPWRTFGMVRAPGPAACNRVFAYTAYIDLLNQEP